MQLRHWMKITNTMRRKNVQSQCDLNYRLSACRADTLATNYVDCLFLLGYQRLIVLPQLYKNFKEVGTQNTYLLTYEVTNSAEGKNLLIHVLGIVT